MNPKEGVTLSEPQDSSQGIWWLHLGHDFLVFLGYFSSLLVPTCFM